MPTLNISMPDALRDFVEARADEGSYSSSEYIRQLVREARDRHVKSERDLLWQLLAIREEQADDGDFVETSVGKIMARGKARREAEQA